MFFCFWFSFSVFSLHFFQKLLFQVYFTLRQQMNNHTNWKSNIFTNIFTEIKIIIGWWLCKIILPKVSVAGFSLSFWIVELSLIHLCRLTKLNCRFLWRSEWSKPDLARNLSVLQVEADSRNLTGGCKNSNVKRSNIRYKNCWKNIFYSGRKLSLIFILLLIMHILKRTQSNKNY
jgi:hypothetical protein